MHVNEIKDRLQRLEALVKENYETKSDYPDLEFDIEPDGTANLSYTEYFKSCEWTLFCIDFDISELKQQLDKLEQQVKNKEFKWR